MALTSSSHFRVATDSRTGLPLADYSWLPQRLHSAFQAMLELDDGIALLHFACEVVMIHVQQPSPTTFSSSAARARQLLQPTETNTVLLVSPDALYFCSPGGDIMEAIPVDAIDSILLCDHWMCLCTPSTPRDTVFALVQHGAAGGGGSLSPPRRTTGRELPQRQQDFIAILNAIRVMKDVRRIAPMVLDSHYAIVSRLQQPLRARRGNNTSPPPIPFLSFEEIRANVVRPNDLIDVLTFVRRLRCPRLETWELEKRERDRHASSQQRRLDDVTAPSAEDQRVSRIVVQKLTQDRAATKRVASSPPKKARNGNTSHQLPLGDTAPPPTAQQRGTRAQRLANLLDDNDEDDEQCPPQQPRSHHTPKAQTSDTLSQDAVSDSVLAAIRAYGARTTTHQHSTADSSYHSMEDKTDDVAAAELLSTSSSRYSHGGLASSSRHPLRHADPSIGIQHHMQRGEPHEQSFSDDLKFRHHEVHRDYHGVLPTENIEFQRRTTSDTAKTVEMMLSSNVSATHDEDDVVDSPPPQLPIPLPEDGSRRPRQQAQVKHTIHRKGPPPPRSDHPPVISATVPVLQQKASRHKSTGFMSPTSSTLARREAAAIERRQAEQATREEKESERHAWSSTTPRPARVTAAARPRPSPPRTPPVTQTSKIATVAEVRKQTTSASPKRTRRSSPPALGGEVPLSTIGREGLMMVWQELKSQKSTLEALTRHVEALVLETPTTADVGHRVTQRQKSLSPEQLRRHAEVVDQQYHNVVDRLETLSAFQRNLLLRPLPEHHPALTPITPPKTAPAHHRHNGAPSVQQRVDDLVRAAAPERKQLSAPSRPKVKVRQ